MVVPLSSFERRRPTTGSDGYFKTCNMSCVYAVEFKVVVVMVLCVGLGSSKEKCVLGRRKKNVWWKKRKNPCKIVWNKVTSSNSSRKKKEEQKTI